MQFKLDEVDWKILRELQTEGRITNVELARRVGISAPPCLRRMRALEETGVVKHYFALLDERKLGYDVSAFAMVSLQAQSEIDLRNFEEMAEGWSVVRECYMLSGEVDFILRCVATDLSSFQDFIIKELTAAPNVAGVKTALVIRRTKFAPGVPLGS